MLCSKYILYEMFEKIYEYSVGGFNLQQIQFVQRTRPGHRTIYRWVITRPQWVHPWFAIHGRFRWCYKHLILNVKGDSQSPPRPFNEFKDRLYSIAWPPNLHINVLNVIAQTELFVGVSKYVNYRSLFQLSTVSYLSQSNMFSKLSCLLN